MEQPGLVAWMEQILASGVASVPGARLGEYRELLAWCASRSLDQPSFWQELPGAVRAIFGRRGWAWNGIYVLRGGDLLLFAAAGPPVCHTLPGQGSLGSAGMCHDALLMNQTLAARDVGAWPGYVSCDATSGLATKAGLVCPIRSASGRPVAVWDLDSKQELAPSDPFFCDRFFASLSALAPPTAATFAL